MYFFPLPFIPLHPLPPSPTRSTLQPLHSCLCPWVPLFLPPNPSTLHTRTHTHAHTRTHKHAHTDTPWGDNLDQSHWVMFVIPSVVGREHPFSSKAVDCNFKCHAEAFRHTVDWCLQFSFPASPPKKMNQEMNSWIAGWYGKYSKMLIVRSRWWCSLYNC